MWTKKLRAQSRTHVWLVCVSSTGWRVLQTRYKGHSLWREEGPAQVVVLAHREWTQTLHHPGKLGQCRLSLAGIGSLEGQEGGGLRKGDPSPQKRVEHDHLAWASWVCASYFTGTDLQSPKGTAGTSPTMYLIQHRPTKFGVFQYSWRAVQSQQLKESTSVCNT